MTINLMSLSQVKSELDIGSTDTTYDTQITAMLPKVSADVRRILNNNFDTYVSASFDSTADTISLSTSGERFYYGDGTVNAAAARFPIGQVVYHPNLTADSYIESYDPDTGLHTLSDTPSGAGEYVYPTINIAQWAAIAKMIWYKISKIGTSDTTEKAVSSESYGKISKTYSSSEVNKKWNYPQLLLDDLGTPQARIG